MRLWNKLRSRFQDGLAEEMRQHREMIEERLRADGMSASEARTRAAREFGPLATAIEDGRAEWSFAWLEALWSDTRYACRALARDKTFAATAVLTLGAGLGLASVAFTLFNAYVLRPFAVADPDSLYAVQWRGKQDFVSIHPWRDYEELRGRKDVFADVFAARGVDVGGIARHSQGTLVSDNYFRMLGARIAMGRGIEAGDAHVVVLSHVGWQAAFGGDPGVLGKTWSLRGQTFQVIGVTGQEFVGLDDSPPDFWAPIGMLRLFRAEEAAVSVEVIGRLRGGMSTERAKAALAAMAERLAPGKRPELDSRATPVSFHPLMLVFFSPVLLALGLVMTTCCANVANMLMARGLARQREIGIRLSVGAGRGRLVRQLLTEALAIAGLAGVVGIVLAQAGLDAGQRIFFATASPEFTKYVRLFSLAPDFRVFLFALSAASVAAVGAALLPALQSTRPNLVAALRGEFGGFRASRMRDAMVVLQVIVCAVLLVCGALLYRRAGVFQAHDPGMRQHGVISLSGEGRGPEFIEELRARPDVEEAALVKRAPWFGRLDRTMVIPSGRSSAVRANFNVVSPSYFRVMAVQLTAGRGFTEEEARAGAPVAIVSQATARTFWPGEDPIGKTIRGEDSKDRFLESLPARGDVRVVGVASDAMHGWVFEGTDRTCLYLPGASAKWALALVRGDESQGMLRLQRWVLDRWPAFEGEVMPLSTMLEVQIYPFRAAAWIGWALGLLAMALTVSGMYGVMSFLVNQRRKEIGIRMALGASPSGVVGMVLRRSVRLAALGVLIGGGFAAIAVKVLTSLSSSVRLVEWDGTALTVGLALAGGAAVLAAVGPSSRAARVDPNTVLRSD